MDRSDRANWLLSGLVGALVAANGLSLAVGRASTVVWQAVGTAVAVGGVLVLVTAARAVRDPSAVDQEWTGRKTALNAVAAVFLALTLAATLQTL